MASRRFPFISLPTLVVCLFASCSNQSEGERCDPQSGNEDCATGLVCVAGYRLIGADPQDARCCPPDQAMTPSSDSRCRRSGAATPSASGGTAGAGGAAAGQAGAPAESGGSPVAGGGGESSGGSSTAGSGQPCNFSSDCLIASEVCGPSGTCQWQCLGDKDCAAPAVCNTELHVCVAPPMGGAAGSGG